MIYQPEEDSYLMQEMVKKFAYGKVLEVGIGSGIQIKTAYEMDVVESVTGIDIKKECVDHCQKEIEIISNDKKLSEKKYTIIQSDLFEKIDPNSYDKINSKANGKFDTIIFNPPYLPEQEGEDKELSTNVSGGKKGYEIILRFLESVGEYLETDGQALLLFSSLSHQSVINTKLDEMCFEYDLVAEKAMNFEQLYIYRIYRSDIRQEIERRGVRNIRSLTHGHRGMIYTGKLNVDGTEKKIAVKVQRTDIGVQGTVDNEVRVIRKFQDQNLLIGPKLLMSGKDYFCYEFVEGKMIMEYFNHCSDLKEVFVIIENVFKQMYQLDKLGMNKEEMHHPLKHVIVGSNVTVDSGVVLLDFERCKENLKLHNVTQFIQFVLSTHMKEIWDKFGVSFDVEKIRELSRDYSESYERGFFDEIIREIICNR